MIEFDVPHIFFLFQHLSELAMRVSLFVAKIFFVQVSFEKLNVNAYFDVIDRRKLILLYYFGIISLLDLRIIFFSSTLLLIFTIFTGFC